MPVLPRERCLSCVVFFNDTATTEIYTLSLHDALPISSRQASRTNVCQKLTELTPTFRDRKSGSAGMPRPISYAVFCLKKKKNVSAGERVTGEPAALTLLHESLEATL